MKGKLLPIGSVVMLEGGTKPIMISGYYAKNENDSKVYTYSGCIFPEGFMENVFCLFDAYEIYNVLYMGLENEESNEYLKKIDGMVNAVSGTSYRPIDDNNKNGGPSNRRTPKAPTNPMSKSEMHAKFTQKKASGNGQSDVKIMGRDF